MKGKGKVIFYIFSFLLAIIALTTSTFAWITSVKRSSNIVFVTGEVKYSLTGEFNTTTNIISNTELVDSKHKFILTNLSTIDSELRIQISYQFTSSTTPDDKNWIYFKDTAINQNGVTNNTDKLLGTLSTDVNSKWVFNKENLNDNMWYYENNLTDPEEKKIIKANDKITIPVLESMFLNGNATGNDDSLNNNLIVKIYFQAKQHKFVEWKDLGAVTVII